MTRLRSDDIRDVPATLLAYDQALVRMTGRNLSGIACRTCGVSESKLKEIAPETRVGVIPVTWGLGTIQGFAETVKAIVKHLGFEAYITREPNVAGLCEAAEMHSDVIMLSDDDHFSAVHLKTGKSVANAAATGKVFAVGLDLMAGGLAGQSVLVVGCGPVGRYAGFALLQLGAELSVVDLDRQKACGFAREARRLLQCEVGVADALHEALLKHRYILDASPAAEIIHEQHVADGTLISAPGVPLGLTGRALTASAGRLLHDPLQLGVAAMIVAAVHEARDSASTLIRP